MAGIKDYSITPGSNTSLFPEGQTPSSVNDGMRQVQADIRAWYNDAEWVVYGDGDGTFTISYAGATSFTVNGIDVTAEYHAGRRVKASGALTGTIYGTIASSSFAASTTVTVAWDSGSLQSEALTVHLAILRATNLSLPSASTTGKGAVELATTAETSAGADAVRAVTPAGLAAGLPTLTTDVMISSSDPGAGSGPFLTLDRGSASPAASDNIGQLRFRGRDSAASTILYAKITGQIVDPTAASADGELDFNTTVAGVDATRMSLGQGVQVGTPTGGDKGAGSINLAADIYRNNAVYNNPDYVLEHWATGRIVKFNDNPGAADYPGVVTLAEVEKHARERFHLPRIGREPSGSFARLDMLLEKVEEIFVHLIEIDRRLRTLETGLDRDE